MSWESSVLLPVTVFIHGAKHGTKHCVEAWFLPTGQPQAPFFSSKKVGLCLFFTYVFLKMTNRGQKPEIPVHLGPLQSWFLPTCLPQALFSPKNGPGFLGRVPSGKRPFRDVFGARKTKVLGCI